VANRLVKVVLRGDIADLQAKMAVAAKSVGDAANKMTGASKESAKFRQGLTTLGASAGKVGLVAAAGIGVAVAAAARFDSAMSKVQAATHESASNMELLRAAAIKAGADTVFSATEAADAITAMSKAGVSTKDILAGGLNGALSLASAGELDVANAAEIAATAMNQFGLAGKDIPHIADLLAAGAGKAQGEVTDMAAALKFVGPVAHQMGISIEETTGTIAELASQGIIGEQAGTSLRGMLTALTSPSQMASKEMQKLGISLYDANGQFVGLRGIADQLGGTMDKLTNAERDQALGRIFGNEQITAARILYAGGAEAVDKWTASVNDQGYAAETAAIKMDNLSGDLEQFKGSLETALIGAGEGSQGPLRSLVQNATAATNALNNLPSGAKNATVGLLGITAVLGGGLWFGSKVIRSVSDTRNALDQLGVDATRVGRLMRTAFAAGAVIEGLNLIETSLDGIFNQELDTSKLGRSLTALADGRVTGEFLQKYGSDLQGFADDMGLATDKANAFQRTVGKIPLVGGFIAAPPWQKSVVDAAHNIDTLDEALANLVESGQGEQAAAIFNQLTAAAVAHGQSADDVKNQLDQYAVALGNEKDAALGSSGAARLVSDAMTGLLAPLNGAGKATGALGVAAQQSAADLAAQAKALAASREAANKTAHQFVGLGKSLNDTKVSLGGWITDLEKQASALRDFTKNVKKAGKEGVREGLIKELEAAGPEGALRLQQLANASEKEIRRANRAWKSGQDAIDAYTDAVGGVPPVTLSVNSSAAESALARIRREITNIPKQWRTDYYVIQHNAISKPRVLPGNPGGVDVTPADGGTITHAASGWTVAGPRLPYGDKVHALLAPGEEVITNRHGEADQFRADRAAGRIPAYAAGSVSIPAGGGSSIDYDRLAGAFSGSQMLGHRMARDAHLDALRTALREVKARTDADLSFVAGGY
jgi:TP901 family phage tail tape measure protein